MFKTLSGRLTTLDQDVEDISTSVENAESNTRSAASIYRYIGIVDKVTTVYSGGNMDTGVPSGTEFDAMAENDRILLTTQTTATENRVYEKQGTALKLVDHTLEDGNMVEDLSNVDPNKTVFYQYDAATEIWTALELVSGTVVV